MPLREMGNEIDSNFKLQWKTHSFVQIRLLFIPNTQYYNKNCFSLYQNIN